MRTEDHPVGFRKYILLAAFGFRLRLHIWRGPGSDSRHNHRWWFVSLPLFGRFQEIRYGEKHGEEYLKIAVYDQDAMRDSGRLYQQTGNTGLDMLRVRTRYPLVPYFCPPAAIHSLTPHGGGVHVSLVLIGRLRRETSDIWRRASNLDVPLNHQGHNLSRQPYKQKE